MSTNHANLDGYNNYLSTIWSVDDPNSANPSGLSFDAAIQCKDLRTFNPNKRFKLYKNARPFTASMEKSW